MINQEEIHRKCFSRDSKERIEALDQLKDNFESFPDKRQACDDLHQLTSYKNGNVRGKAAEVFGTFFRYIPDKKQAWEDLHRLTTDKSSFVRSKAASAIGFASLQLPDKQQAWNDLIKLTNDKDRNVRSKASFALGSVFSQVPDKQQAWSELHRLINSEDKNVRARVTDILDFTYLKVQDKLDIEEVQLKVEKAYPIDRGRGIVRLDPTALLKLQLSPGDIVEIQGKKKTTAKVWRADRQDWEQGIVRIDNFIRQNAGVSIGEKVTIKKVEAQEAKKIILALPESMTQGGSELQFGEYANEIIKRHILKRPVFRGDIIPIINSMSQPMTESLTTSQVIPLVVAETEPANTVVLITEVTVIKFLYNKNNFNKNIEEYLKNIINEDSKIGINDCYTELLAKEILPISLKHLDEQTDLSINFTVLKLVEMEKNLIISGGPGSGKTTTLRWLNFYLAANYFEEKESGIPLYVGFDSYKGGSFYDYLKLNAKKYGLSEGAFNTLLEGRVIFLLDGFDLLFSTENFIPYDEISDFISEYSSCRFIISSRPSFFESIKSDFKVLELEKLTEEKIQIFIDKYVLDKELRETLKNKILNDQQLKSIFTTPMMLYLIIKAAIERKNNIEDLLFSNRSKMYEIFVSGLFEHNTKKGNTLHSNKEQIENVLMDLFFNLKQRDEILCKYSEALKIVKRNSKDPIFRKISPQVILEDCFKLGFLNKNGYYVSYGIHQSLQDYFTAKELKRLFENGFEVLETLSNPKWKEVVKLTAEMIESVDGNLGSQFNALIIESHEKNPGNEASSSTQSSNSETNKIELSINTARELIVEHNYLQARALLENIVKLPEYKKQIKEEFDFLYNFEAPSEEDRKRFLEKEDLVGYQTNLWYVLSDKSKFSLNKEISIINKLKKDEEIKHVLTEDLSHDDNLKEITNKIFDGNSQEKGEVLENAVIDLFRELFIIDKDEEMVRQELRKQRAGLQFGFDVGFECTLKENKNVKCHIECKNLSEKDPIKLSHIAEKLLQTQSSYPNIDHWILICPTTEPANELHQYISESNDLRRFSFNIQIWSKNIVEEFFGLNPKVYDLFFKSREGEAHPSQWTPEKRGNVFEKWKDKLKPLIRLPIEWDHYLREPSLMCFKGEDPKELDFLYQNHVQMECTDEQKNVLNKSMEEYVHEWLNNNRIPLMFLLGEFGDGKSVFTYILSRKLAEEYYENPSDGWIPIRFTLREYCNTKNSQKFLKERLERFDVSFASWDKVKEKNKILVILDGFDELTKKLDSVSISRHINILKDCCDEFKNMKIIVTSRTHFLEKQRDKERLLQRLPAHRMCYLAPIARKSCLQYLGNSVDTSEEKQILKNIEKMHDPIGLASKPLFLQMIRQTLSELPKNNLNEVILYKTYINKSLRRKIELLDDDKMEILPDEIYSNLIRILESTAIKLQMSNQEFICLAEEFSGKDEKDLAKRLWQISDSDDLVCKNIEQEKTIIDDATARVGIRSLLTKVTIEKDEVKWPVDFCHRSMREYFVAMGICSTLMNDMEKAREFFGKLQLNPEILYFASEMMKEDSKIYEEKLSQIILENKSNMREKVSVGNVATLLYRLKGELPGEDWSDLNLEGANLSGADLSGKNFFATNLRNSCLDNANFEMADFRECDLTGVRIEETSKALSIALHPSGSKIIAAYEDNIIREWKIAQRFKLEYRNLGKCKKGSIRQLFSYNGSDLCLIMNEEAFLYDYSDTNELIQKACFKIKPEYKHIVAKKDGLILIYEDEEQMKRAFCVNTQHEILCSKEVKDLTICEILNPQIFIIAANNNIKIVCEGNDRETITLEVSELTSLCTFCLKKEEKYLVACGQRNGNVLVWKIDILDEKIQYKPLLNSHIHDGIASSLVFLDETRIISSGLDRKISIHRFEEGSEDLQGITEKIFYLTVKCEGMRVEGLKSDTERKMLEKLIKSETERKMLG